MNTDTLIVVNDAAVARHAGMGLNGRHRGARDVLFWWPSCGMEKLQGLQVGKVIIYGHLSEHHWQAINALVVRPPCVVIRL